MIRHTVAPGSIFSILSLELISEWPVEDPEERVSSSPLTLSMLTSEWVYRLICLVERLIRWFNKAVLRPYLFLFRSLIG